MRTGIPVLRVQGPQTQISVHPERQRLVKRGTTIINVQSKTYFSRGTKQWCQDLGRKFLKGDN